MEKGKPNERSQNSNLMDSIQEMTRDWQEKLTINKEACTSLMETPLQEAVKNELTCYICDYYMVSPIFQCKNGHTLCTRCNSKVNNKCPTCREILEGNRNRALENIAAILSLPCKYADSGCKEKITHFFKSEHEFQCRFRPYNCIHEKSECNFTGSANFLLEHLHKYNGHDELVVTNNDFEIVCILEELEENDKYVPVVKAHDNYFFFHLEKYYVGSIPWIRAFMDYLGDQDEANNFCYEIKVGKQPNEHVFNGVPQSVRKMRDVKEEKLNINIFKIMLSQAYLCSSPDHEVDGSILTLNCKILKKNA